MPDRSSIRRFSLHALPLARETDALVGVTAEFPVGDARQNHLADQTR
jgi:hypothetical protein